MKDEIKKVVYFFIFFVCCTQGGNYGCLSWKTRAKFDYSKQEKIVSIRFRIYERETTPAEEDKLQSSVTQYESLLNYMCVSIYILMIKNTDQNITKSHIFTNSFPPVLLFLFVKYISIQANTFYKSIHV